MVYKKAMLISRNSKLYIRFSFVTVRFFFVAVSVNGSNVTVEYCAGENVTLVCRTDLAVVNWLHIHLETAKQRVINAKSDDGYRAVASSVNGSYSLLIPNAQANDSGWYVCVEENIPQRSSTTVRKHLVLVTGRSDVMLFCVFHLLICCKVITGKYSLGTYSGLPNI
jgi:hypothetical protein